MTFLGENSDDSDYAIKALFIYLSFLGNPFNHSGLFFHGVQNTNKNYRVLNKHNVRNITCETPKYTNDII